MSERERERERASAVTSSRPPLRPEPQRYQALALGVSGLAAPAWTAARFGVDSLGPAATMSMRGAALVSMLFGGRLSSGNDADAAKDGFVWTAATYWILRGAQGAAAARMRTWALVMAVFAARESGGLWNTITSADTSVLNRLLPADYDASIRNFVGGQMLGWGLALLLRPAMVTSMMGIKASTDLITKMLAVNNLVMGGRCVGGNDSDAASNGVLFFGGWTVLLTLASRAGAISGQYVLPLQIWNLASAAYCFSQR